MSTTPTPPPARSTSLTWPLILITLGVIFLLGQFSDWGFSRSWPVLLIVFGVLKLVNSSRPPQPPRGPSV